MLTFGNKISLRDAEIVVFNLYKRKCIHEVASCFVCSLLAFHVPACTNRRKSVSCMPLSGEVELQLKGAAKVSKGLLVSLS